VLQLYYALGACSLASHIALEEAGAPYEGIRIDLKAGDQRQPNYLKVNPKGRVPTLITDRGILTENPAILAFIAQSFPAAKLAPIDDPFAFAQVQSFNAYLCATVHVAHAHRARGARWVDANDTAALEAMKRKVPESVGACFDLIERSMFKGPWVMGESYTICDPYLFTLASWLENDSIDPKRFPRVYDHRNRMAERPATKRTLAMEKAAVAA
jgi:glutathione S-transferase